MVASGARTADALVDAALKEIRSAVKSRLSGRSKGGRSGSSGSGGGNAVIDLTESSFESEVLNSEDTWLVAFVAPWCGHCQRLKPEWAKAASELKGEVKLGQVDATVHTGLASRYGVRGYPSIKVSLPRAPAQRGRGAGSKQGIGERAGERLRDLQRRARTISPLYSPLSFLWSSA